jgi:signal transduction histidine kinase
MREPGQRGELTPTPRLGDLPDLVAGLQQQDLAICLELAVDPATVPDALQTSVYRVVQEALSNVVRHAGSSRAEVVIRHRQGQLGVVVQDNGTTRASANHQGHGLRGMRERIAQHGGELRVGPRSEGGWLVHAEIPLALR